MRYREQKPSAELAQFVECFWFLEQDEEGGAPEPPLERLLPIGAIEVVLHHGSRFREGAGAASERRLPPGVIAGQLTEPKFIRPEGAVSTMGLRFSPGGAYPFFGTRLDALTGVLAGFEDVWDGDGRRLEDRLLSSRGDSERVRVTEEFLLSRLGSGRRDPVVEAGAREIQARRGRLRVSALGRVFGLSARQMERRFGSALGIGPKSLCRVVRFQSLVRRLARGGAPEWAGMAVEAGYCDQSHLIGEVRRLSGLTPSGLAARQTPVRPAPGFTLTSESGLRVCPAST